MMQEVMASWLGCTVGEYCHLADSMHIYEKDLEEFSVQATEFTDSDCGTLTLSYDTSKKLFSDLYCDLSVVSEGGRNEEQLRDIFSRESKQNKFRPDFIKDIMVVVGSDAARRNGYSVLSNELAQSCADAGLRFATLAWLNSRRAYHE
jgi:hypothetical protein